MPKRAKEKGDTLFSAFKLGSTFTFERERKLDIQKADHAQGKLVCTVVPASAG